MIAPESLHRSGCLCGLPLALVIIGLVIIAVWAFLKYICIVARGVGEALEAIHE